MRAPLGGRYDGREITHPTAPGIIVVGYEGIIGGQERPLASRGYMCSGVIAVMGARHGL